MQVALFIMPYKPVRKFQSCLLIVFLYVRDLDLPGLIKGRLPNI